MNSNLTLLILGMFISLSEGTATIQVPIAGNCGDDTVLTCQVSGSIGSTGWYGFNRDLVVNGVPAEPEDSNKYTETRGTSSFTLTIHNTDITDEGYYRCQNGFDESQLKRFNIECKASSSTHSVKKGKKVQITVDKLYPASPTLTATFKRQNSAIQISGSSGCSSSTQYTGYYKCVWTSRNSLDDGSYTYSIVVKTITQATPLTGSFIIASPNTPSISNVVELNATHEVVYGNEGQSLTIQCTSTGGFPSPTVTLYKNSISSSNQLATTSLGTLQSDGTYTVNLQHTFTPATSDDRKYLICRSYYPQADSAHVGSNSKSVLLSLRLKPSQPTVTQTSVVSSGSTVTVRCTTSGCRPAASISWLYQGVTYNSSTTNTADAATETFTVVSIYTRRVTAADNGQSIQCIVTHPALVSPAQLTRSTRLNVLFSVGPSTTQITGNREIIATGSTPLTLTCTTGSSNPASDITWRNGSHILESNRPYTTSTGVNNGVVRSQQLILYPTRYIDGDEITCSVSNSVSQSPVVDKIKLNLKYDPLIKPISDVIVVEGNNTELICAASSKPASTFKWYKQGHSKVLRSGAGTLEYNKLSYPLTNVRRGDAATYTCNANNGIENADNKKVLLTVYYPPDVSATTKNTTINAAKAIVTCNANGVPENNYTFGKWVQTWPGYNTAISEHSGSERLELTGLTYEHSGIYTCTASNGIKVFGTNQEYMEGSVQLVVKSLPIITYFSEKTSSKLMENATKDVYYFSNAAGSNIKIYKNMNGSRLEDVNYSVTETTTQVNLKVFRNSIKTAGVRAKLLIHVQTKDDIGSYDIVVSNEINSSVRSFEIVAKGPPSLPFNLTIDNVNYNEARLSWRRGYHGGFPQTFVIQLSTDHKSWRDVKVFDGKNESNEMISKLLPGLSPSTIYFVRMYSFNQEGNSAATGSLNYTTSSKKLESNSNGALIGGVVGGLLAGFVVVGIVIFIFVSKRTALNKGISRHLNTTRCFGRNQDEKRSSLEMESNSINIMQSTYEQLHHPVERDSKIVYDNLNAAADSTKCKSEYEILQTSNLSPYDTLTTANVEKGGDQLYENLKVK